MAGNTTTHEYSWLDMIRRADPDHSRESRFCIEYEFTAPERGGDKRTHEGGKRVFRGYYDIRGAYTPETPGTYDLTWGGLSINWNGEPLTWGDD